MPPRDFAFWAKSLRGHKIEVKQNQKNFAYSKVYALQKFQVAFQIIFARLQLDFSNPKNDSLKGSGKNNPSIVGSGGGGC